MAGGVAPSPVPTGTVTFTVYGPDDAACAGTPVFTSANRPLAGGPPPTAGSDPFTPTVVGSYNWVAAYSGDATYAPVTSPCGEPNETSVVVPAPQAVISTQATPSATLGGSVTDAATVTGGPAPAPAPTGTVTFTAFGPDDATCTGPPAFTSSGQPLGGGPPPTATSGPFTPTAPGAYRWVAVYSGDAMYAPVTSPCGASDETSLVTPAPVATIATQATPTTSLGGAISDVATVTGAPAPAPAPTGTVTFTLFGPDDATCAATPVFTGSPQPLAGGPPPTATSEDFTPSAPGTYRWVAVYDGDATYPMATSPCNAANETSLVLPPSPPVIITQATPSVGLGGPIVDTATVAGGPAPAPVPTGTVTFTAFGPGNATCTGAPAFTSSARPLAGGPPPTASSSPFTPTAPGTYRWVAVYSGDATYAGVTSPCGAPDETSVVTPAPAAHIVTQATPTVLIGGSISDTATVSGGAAPTPSPTGFVTFTVFGPNNATCTGAPIFTSAAQPLGGGPPPTATSAAFTPTTAGTYRWVASYTGDANYVGVTGACNDPGETSVVTQVVDGGRVTTQATPTATLGSPISDTAIVTGNPAPVPVPTGTVTFTLFGPDNPTCTGAPIFTSANRPLGGGPPVTTTSDPFTPTVPGAYNWVAAYSGDANYVGGATSCGDLNETSVVTPAPVATLTTQATSSFSGLISDTATVTGGPAPAPTPTGVVTFTVYGPDDPTCTGAPIFTSSAQPLAGGPPPTAFSGSFFAPTPGAYRWIAAYSGDANYPAVTGACNDPNETSMVTGEFNATISTQATANVIVGQPISDTATVTGGRWPGPARAHRHRVLLAVRPSRHHLRRPRPLHQHRSGVGRRSTSDRHLRPFHALRARQLSVDRLVQRRRQLSPGQRRLQRPERDVGGDAVAGRHHRHGGVEPGHHRQSHPGHRDGHRSRRPRPRSDRNRHVHPVRAGRPRLRWPARLHQQRPPVGRRAPADGDVRGLHAHRARHLQLGGGLQR